MPDRATPAQRVSLPVPRPPTRRRTEAFFRRWALTVVRFRWAFLALILLSSAYMLYLARTQLRVDNSTEAFLAADDESSVVLEALRDAFGQDVVYQVLATGDVFSLAYLERLRALHRELESLDMPLESLGVRRRAGSAEVVASDGGEAGKEVGDGDDTDPFASFGQAEEEDWGDEAGGSIVDQLISLINVRRTSWTGDGMRVSGLLDEWPSEAQLPALRQTVLSNPTLVGQVVGRDGRHSVVVIRTQFMDEHDSGLVYNKLVEIARRHSAPGFELEVAGAPALFVSLNARMMDDLGLTFSLSIILMVGITFLIFRHPIGVIAPQLVCVLAAVWTMGALALSGRPMTMITNVLPAFLLCVGIGDSIHVQSVYRDARRRGHANLDAIVYAVGATAVPVLFTSLTTAVGLLSFRFAHLAAIRDMGTFGAFGVMVALLNSLVLLPALLSFNRTSLLGARASAHGADRLDRALAFLDGLSRPAAPARPRSTRVLVLVVGALLAIASAAAASTMRVYHNPLKWFPEDDVTRMAVDHLDENVGGMATVALLVEAPPGESLRNRETLVALEKLERHILSYRDPAYPQGVVTNATSVLDVVRESWRAVHAGDPRFYRLPEEPRGVADMLTLFENASPDELSRLVTVDFSKSVMTLRAHWLDAWAYRPLVAHIEAGVAKFFPGRVTVKATGTVFSTVSVVSTLLADLLRSFATAFVVITLFMVVLLRDVRLGLIAMVPNLLPIMLTMGYMVATGTPVDTTTLMVASIAIGIAVDDTIHFVHQFVTHFREHGDAESAIAHAFSHTGRAMVSTSLILIAGFLSLNAGYMGNMKAFGTLISVTVAFALLSDLILAPALLRTFYGASRRRPASETGDAPKLS